MVRHECDVVSKWFDVICVVCGVYHDTGVMCVMWTWYGVVWISCCEWSNVTYMYIEPDVSDVNVISPGMNVMCYQSDLACYGIDVLRYGIKCDMGVMWTWCGVMWYENDVTWYMVKWPIWLCVIEVGVIFCALCMSGWACQYVLYLTMKQVSKVVCWEMQTHSKVLFIP